MEKKLYQASISGKKRNIMSRPVLWEKLEKNAVRCNICHNRCVIPEGRISRCYSRKNVSGEMELNTYGLASSIAVDPIEKKPLYHFYPGTQVFSVGGWGCNFKCKHCQNWNISQSFREDAVYFLTPEDFTGFAQKYDCQGVCWTYNEPAIWLEYTIDTGKIAKENGLYTAYITNGFMTIEALDLMSPYLDAYRVDLKSFDDEFYREICGVQSAKKVFETTLRAKEHGMHIEAVTNIIPTKNDSEENLRNIARWIKENLGEDTPWHVTRFFPCYQLMDIEPTPIETIQYAEQIGREEGLFFIYPGNIPEKSITKCPDCEKVAVQRELPTKIYVDKNGNCQGCGKYLNIKLK